MTSINKTAPLPYEDEPMYEYNSFVRPTSYETDEENSAYHHNINNIKRSKSCTRLPTQLTRTPSVKRFHRRRRASPKSSLLASTPLSIQTHHMSYETEFSEQEFSFSEDSYVNSPLNSSGSDSDLESLPDTEQSTPNTSPLYNSNKLHDFPFILSNSAKKSKAYFFDQQQEIKEQQEQLLYHQQIQQTQQPSIFEIPEIVHKIIKFADLQSTIIPQEGTTIRRKPLSLKHAMLIYGNSEDAEAAMKDKRSQSSVQEHGILYNCLMVNRLFHEITKEIIQSKFFFSSEPLFQNYIQTHSKSTVSPESRPNPSMVVFHKLYSTKSAALDVVNKHIGYKNLEWVEFYMCPKLLPSLSMFENGFNIKKFVVTGSKVMDDSLLIHVSKKCRHLEVLDVRACELISDSGVYSIGKYCKRLTSVNFGRKKKGHLITDNSLSLLVRNNPNLNTIGLAGCNITDKVLWEIAIVCNRSVERLSLNNCTQITNQSIPLILHSNYFPNLSVLELRFVDQLTNFMPIIEFKRRQELRGITTLIEVCEVLCTKMQEQEREMDRAISKRIFRDILDWVNDTDDDVSHHSLISARNSIASATSRVA
ncbi:antagonist of mitotic exit network protein 1 [[Candida] anglica]